VLAAAGTDDENFHSVQCLKCRTPV
jgi:hypothetical protein